MTSDSRNDDHNLLAWAPDSGPQWLGGALATLLWLIAAGFWRNHPIIAGGALLLAGVIAIVGVLLPRLGDFAVIPRRVAPWLSALAVALIAIEVAFY